MRTSSTLRQFIVIIVVTLAIAKRTDHNFDDRLALLEAKVSQVLASNQPPKGKLEVASNQPKKITRQVERNSPEWIRRINERRIRGGAVGNVYEGLGSVVQDMVE